MDRMKKVPQGKHIPALHCWGSSCSVPAHLVVPWWGPRTS